MGIDVAQKELVVCLARMNDNWASELYAHKSFPNTQKGFSALIEWVSSFTDPSVPVRYAMEATGVYHEALAYFLDSCNCEVSIVLPTKISNYVRTLEVKTITDKTAAQAIARFAIERTLDSWQPPNPLYKKLRQLTREREQLNAEQTVLSNQLHAEKAEAQPNKKSIDRITRRLALTQKHQGEIAGELSALVKSNEEVNQVIRLLTSIVGVGLITAATVLAETNGFELIRNKRQITSYAGLDIQEKQSGTSVKGRPRISKRGNKYLRKAMYMPALTAIRHDERYKAIYTRLIAKHGIKMKAAVAIQRKLLEMMYTVYKTGKAYNRNFLTTEAQPVSF